MIRVDQDGSVWTLTIDRPDKANSLTGQMLRDLDAGVAAAIKAEAAALVLTGTGRVFSAGADLDEARAGLATDAIWEQLSARIASFDGLSVAALNGTLAGGAFGMALACDLRIGVPEAKFFYPVMQLGFLPQPSDPGRLAALVGPSRAKLILLGAQKILADDALTWGLLDRMVAPDALAETVADVVAAVSTGDASVRRGIKSLLAC